jgi:hypothetical protein
MLALAGMLALAHLDRDRATDLGRYVPTCVIDARIGIGSAPPSPSPAAISAAIRPAGHGCGAAP